MNREIESASVCFTVYGQLVSMKNSKLSLRFKNPDVKRYESDFSVQVPPDCRNLKLGGLTVPLRANISVFYQSHRSDLDCALVYDCLQTAGVVANDNYIREKHEWAHVDPKNPRVEIRLEAM